MQAGFARVRQVPSMFIHLLPDSALRVSSDRAQALYQLVSGSDSGGDGQEADVVSVRCSALPCSPFVSLPLFRDRRERLNFKHPSDGGRHPYQGSRGPADLKVLEPQFWPLQNEEKNQNNGIPFCPGIVLLVTVRLVLHKCLRHQGRRSFGGVLGRE